VKYKIMFILAVCLWAAPSYADFSVGGEYIELSRSLDVGWADVDSDSADTYAAFLGFDAGNSMVYFKIYREESEFGDLSLAYRKDEYSVDWHWNETTAKKNFKNTSFGLFGTSYKIGPAIDADFFGCAAGGGLTHFVTENIFVNGRAKLRLSYNNGEDLFETPDSDPEEGQSFLGYEAQAAIGIQLGRKVFWSVQIGYRVQTIDFEDRFIDDSNHYAFVTMRFFVPSGQ